MEFEIRNPILRRIAVGLVLLAGFAVIGFGIKEYVSLPKHYVKTPAVIVRLAEPSAGGYTTYRYEAEGATYTVREEEYSSSDYVGKEVKIRYNPDNPKEILTPGDTLGAFITMGIGGAVVIISAVVLFKRR